MVYNSASNKILVKELIKYMHTSALIDDTQDLIFFFVLYGFYDIMTDLLVGS